MFLCLRLSSVPTTAKSKLWNKWKTVCSSECPFLCCWPCRDTYTNCVAQEQGIVILCETTPCQSSLSGRKVEHLLDVALKRSTEAIDCWCDVCAETTTPSRSTQILACAMRTTFLISSSSDAWREWPSFTESYSTVRVWTLVDELASGSCIHTQLTCAPCRLLHTTILQDDAG